MAWRKARQADSAKDHRYRAFQNGASPEQSYLGAAGEMNAPAVETNSRRIRRKQVALRRGEKSTKMGAADHRRRPPFASGAHARR